MESLDIAHKKCFKTSKAHVRTQLNADKFLITNQKIVKFCRQFDDDPEKVKPELKKYIGRLRKISLRRIQSLPRQHADPRRKLLDSISRCKMLTRSL